VYSTDVQGKKSIELGCEMKKMGYRMAAMERAAGIGIPPPCQSAHVDLTEDVNTLPRMNPLSDRLRPLSWQPPPSSASPELKTA
jgi:hypothetical protein